MESQKKNWHTEIAQATRLNPNLIPVDLFFQFKKNQPYKLKKIATVKSGNIDKPPLAHTHISREFIPRPHSTLLLRPSSQCSGTRLPELNDSNVSKSSLDTYKIEKNREKILNEIGQLLNKENIENTFTPKELSWREKSEACKEYRHVSQKISRFSRGRIPLRNIKVEMYRKDR